MQTTALQGGEVVVIVGLSGAPQHNYHSAAVLNKVEAADSTMTGDRYAVRLLHGCRPRLSVRRRNILRAAQPAEREQLLVRVLWERQLELRVVSPLLLGKLSLELGICLKIASFFPHRQTMAFTSGFAMGTVVRDWSCVCPDPHSRRFAWHPMRQPAGTSAVAGSIARIDCAVVSIGQGRFFIAGGCDDHPSRMRRFFRSAFVYDALTHAVEPLPDMPCARHGCGGAHINGKVLVFGGEYASSSGGAQACDVYDLERREWSPLSNRTIGTVTSGRGFNPDLRLAGPICGRPVAFVPVGTVGQHEDGMFGGPVGNKRTLVVMTGGHLWMCNDVGVWLSFTPCPPPQLGASAAACVEWGDYLIVSQGREASEAGSCHVFAVRWVTVLVDAGNMVKAEGDWHEVPPHSGVEQHPSCIWISLGTASIRGERVGAGLSVVHGRLHISGGVDESLGFDSSVLQWGGTYADLCAEEQRVVRKLDDTFGDPEVMPLLRHDNMSEPYDNPEPKHYPPDFPHDDAEAAVAAAVSEQDRMQQLLESALLTAADLSGRFAWAALPGLTMPTAMHAHAAITVPLLPHMQQAAAAAPVSSTGS